MIGNGKDWDGRWMGTDWMSTNSCCGRVSVVVPIYRQEQTVAEDLCRIDDSMSEWCDDYEIIAVVDGLIDKSAEVAKNLSLKNLRVIEIQKNQGKGFAVRTGLKECTGEVVGFIDGGMDILPDAIAEGVRIVTGGADIAIGSKRHPLSDVKYPLIRRVFSLGYQGLSKGLFDLTVLDTQVGAKFMRRDVMDAVVNSLKIRGFAMDVELLALARRRGFVKFEEFPVKIDLVFTSSVSWVSVLHMLGDTIQIFWEMRVRKHYDQE
tara:strand:- start:335 stop:1123 length:789 start_codon:yes stop_codon:yes gene_type:complete